MDVSAPAAFNAPAQRADLYHRVLEQIQAVPGVESAGIIGDLFIGNPREQVLTVERRRRNCFRAPAARERRGQRRISSRRSERRCCAGASFRSAIGQRRRGSRSSTMRWLGARGRGRTQWAEGSSWARGIPTARGTPSSVSSATCGGRGWSAKRSRRSSCRSRRILPPGTWTLLIRTSSDDPLTMAGAVRAAVRRVEKNAPIYGVAPLEQQLGTLPHAAPLPDLAPDRLLRRGAPDGRCRDLRAHPVLGRDAHAGNRLAHGHRRTGRRHLPDDHR